MRKKVKDLEKAQQGIERLERELVDIEDASSMIRPMREYEMLSLMVNEAEAGVDISRRYPTFYKDLLTNPDLREAFLDSLEISQARKEDRSVSTASFERSLELLRSTSPTVEIKRLQNNGWRVEWQRTIEQLQPIFSPRELAYRSDPSLSDDPWITIFRDEFAIEGASHTVLLECTLSQASDQSLGCILNIALNSSDSPETLPGNLMAALEWGTYQRILSINPSGRFPFPDIPFDSIFDKRHQRVRSDLHLIIQTSPVS
jgi:hypothetical protein